MNTEAALTIQYLHVHLALPIVQGGENITLASVMVKELCNRCSSKLVNSVHTKPDSRSPSPY